MEPIYTPHHSPPRYYMVSPYYYEYHINDAIAADTHMPPLAHPGVCVEGRGRSVAAMTLWLLYNVAANSAMVVTVSYWTFLTAFHTSGTRRLSCSHRFYTQLWRILDVLWGEWVFKNKKNNIYI